MDFGLSSEMSEDVLTNAVIVTDISQSLRSFFASRNYGNAIDNLTIGIICVSPEFDSFFKARKKYTKAKKMLEYDVTLDHSRFKAATKREIEEMIAIKIIDSLSIIADLKLRHFDLATFRADITVFFDNLLKNGTTYSR